MDENREPTPTAGAALKQAPIVRKQKILVVDDSLTIRMQIKDLLEENGFDVLLAKDEATCFEILENQTPEVILLDIIMPDTDGLNLCRKIKSDETLKEIPILILTNAADVQSKVDGLNAGAEDYITKPFEMSELMARFKAVLRNKELHEKLRASNRHIIRQQKAVVEEERLKVLLQMAGATAHELNQPLMVLLGCIDLLGLYKDNPEKREKYITKIEAAGQRIADIVKKIQSIRRYEVKPYLEEMSIINMDQELKILVIMDSEDDFRMVKTLLANHSWISPLWAADIGAAMSLLDTELFDMVIAEHRLDDGDAFKLIETLKRRRFNLPVCIIIRQEDEVIAAEVIQAGADSYILKSRLDETRLVRRIESVLEKFRLTQETITASDRMAEMAAQDELTGLYSRRFFTKVLEREISRSLRYKEHFCVCLIEPDYMHMVNESYGLLAKNNVLADMGKIVQETFRKSDVLGRYGSEQIGCVLLNTSRKQAEMVCNRFREVVMAQQFSHREHRFRMTVSVGCSEFDGREEITAQALLEKAEEVLYAAKKKGAGKGWCFRPDRRSGAHILMQEAL